MKNVIIVKHLTKKLGGKIILSDVNLQFEEGNIYGFIGRNGSGKTVLLKCICGLMEITEGEIYFNEKKLKKDMEYMESLGILIEHPGFLENISAYENLKFLASIRRIAGKKQIEDSLQKVGLDPDDKKKVGKYSMGMKQRAGIAQAIMEDPTVLILDEPMNGLDEAGVDRIRRLLSELKKEKIILIASHYREDIDLLCDKVYNIRNTEVCELRS